MNKIALADNELVVIGSKENGYALRIPQGRENCYFYIFNL